MRTKKWSKRAVLCMPVILAAGLSGCKAMNEQYIQLEVWKYEKCFGHLPPGFTPPGAAPAMTAAPPRACGQQQPCCDSTPAAAAGCDSCGGSGAVMEGGMPAGVSVPVGPGGSPGPGVGAAVPTPAGITAGKPVVISDEVVIP